MSLLGPDRRITVAEDWAWDIYARRVQLPAWRRSDEFEEPSSLVLYPPPIAPAVNPLWALLDFPFFLVTDVLAPLLRFVLGVPFALLRSIRPKVWTIEAVTFWPREERYVWMTTGPERARVVEEIADALEQRTFAQPRGAVFHGRKR